MMNSIILMRNSCVSFTNFSLEIFQITMKIRNKKYFKPIPIETTPRRYKRFIKETEAEKENK